MGVSALPQTGFLPGMVMAYAGPTTQPGWLLCDGSVVSRTSYGTLFAAIGTAYGAGDGSTTFTLPNLKGKTIVMQDVGQTEFDVLGESGGEKTHVLTVGELPSHTHGFGHTHGMNSVSTDHAHNIYGTGGINTGGISANHTHSFGADNANGVGGTAGLTPGGSNYAIGYAGANTGTVSSDHVHGYDHSHPSTNYQSEATWHGTYDHGHTTNSQSSSTTDNGTGSGGAHNNLQPYLTMNYLIKV